jgi:hypothetical protein
LYRWRTVFYVEVYILVATQINIAQTCKHTQILATQIEVVTYLKIDDIGIDANVLLVLISALLEAYL